MHNLFVTEKVTPLLPVWYHTYNSDNRMAADKNNSIRTFSNVLKWNFLILHDVERVDRPDNNSKEQITCFTQEQFQTSLIAHYVSMDYNNY